VYREGVSQVADTAVPGPAWWVVLATAVFAVLVSASSLAPLVTGKRNALYNVNVFGTIAHEASHAFLTVLTGGGVYRFQITGPDSGATHGWYPSRLSAIAVDIAGYAMPSLAGLGAAALLHRGHAAAVLTITVTTLVLLLFVTRDAITLFSVLLVGVLVFATLYWGPVWLRNWVAYTEAWLLLTSEIGGLANIVANRTRARRRGREQERRAKYDDDADHLADRTHVPASVWIVGWFVVIGWTLWHGVPLLWP
jgi:hypothetical protein